MPYQYKKKHIVEYFKSNNLKIFLSRKILNDDRINSKHTKAKFMDSNGYFYYVSISYAMEKVRNNGRIEIFGKSNPFTLINISNWIIINKQNLKLLENKNSKRIGAKINLKFRCLTCKKIIYKTWDNLKSGRGCPYCTHKIASEFYNFVVVFPELAKRWCYEKNTVSPYDILPYSNKKYWWKCANGKKHSFLSCLNVMVSPEIFCSVCSGNKSYGEFIIEKFLIKNKVKYVRQKTFNQCRYVNLLRFDFYLPEKNICVEYQGIQHYKENAFFGGEDELSTLKKKDRIKRKYCKKNKIKLVEISYLNKKNIEIILLGELS